VAEASTTGTFERARPSAASYAVKLPAMSMRSLLPCWQYCSRFRCSWWTATPALDAQLPCRVRDLAVAAHALEQLDTSSPNCRSMLKAMALFTAALLRFFSVLCSRCISSGGCEHVTELAEHRPDDEADFTHRAGLLDDRHTRGAVE
jgi:hypothetical protein